MPEVGAGFAAVNAGKEQLTPPRNTNQKKERNKRMDLRRIPVADIRPNEKNPRSDFGDIDALWESFALNSANPGEPVNPIVVVADGPVFRIIDGERRWRAMSSNGQESCLAVVCEGYDDVEQATAMLATDDKLSLTPTETCQGIQQMLLLGIDVDRVAAASKAPVEDVKAVRRVLNYRKGEGVFQTTLEQMLAVADVDENGDGDMADQMLTDRNWQSTYDRFKRDRAREDQISKLKDNANAYGFVLLEDDFKQEDYGASRAVWSRGDFQEAWEKGYRYARIWIGDYGVQGRVYLPKGSDPKLSENEMAEERERAERQAKTDDAGAALKGLHAEVAAWFANELLQIGTPQFNNVLKPAIISSLFDPETGRLSSYIQDFKELAGVSHPITPPQLTYELGAVAFGYMYPNNYGYYSLSQAIGLGIEELTEWAARSAHEDAIELCAVINQFVAAGYVPSDNYDRLMRKVEEIAKWSKGDEDD